MAKKVQIYAASPYGFAESTKAFMYESFYRTIQNAGGEVLDPWSHALPDDPQHSDFMELGKRNAEAIEKSDGLVAALDGADVDSGTAAEIGYAAAKGKWIIGYRGDFRQTGDGKQVIVNLQVEYFISKNGGEIVRTLEELAEAIRKRSES